MRMYIDWFDTEGTSTVYRWHHRPSHPSSRGSIKLVHKYWKKCQENVAHTNCKMKNAKISDANVSASGAQQRPKSLYE